MVYHPIFNKGKNNGCQELLTLPEHLSSFLVFGKVVLLKCSQGNVRRYYWDIASISYSVYDIRREITDDMIVPIDKTIDVVLYLHHLYDHIGVYYMLNHRAVY
jgi:hypothetical protein